MYKKLIIIILLLIINILSLDYLNECTDNKKVYYYDFNNKQYVIQKKDIILNKIGDFDLDEYFHIFSFENGKINYSFEDSYLYLFFDGYVNKYPFLINE